MPDKIKIVLYKNINYLIDKNILHYNRKTLV